MFVLKNHVGKHDLRQSFQLWDIGLKTVQRFKINSELGRRLKDSFKGLKSILSSDIGLKTVLKV